MKNFAFALALFSSACVSVTHPAPPAPALAPSAAAVQCNPGYAILNATLWMQTAAEYRASATQTYATARRTLDAALADPSWTALSPASAGLPPAIILDLDETAMDNLTFESRVIRKGKAYDPKDWDQWVSEAAAPAIPGAAEFLAYAKSRGVTPFYITNRNADQEAATRGNLEKLGYPLSATEDTLLLQGERPEWKPSDKTPRRDFVASTHRVLMLFGDDLNDFAAASGKTRAERDAIVASHANDWGRTWFILPNPIYGSWERAAIGDTRALDNCGQLQRRVESLR